VLTLSLDSIVEKLAKHEERLDSHQRLLNSQSEKNEALTRIVTLVEIQEKHNSEREARQEERDRLQQEQLNKFSDAMNKMVITMSDISNSQEKLGETQHQLGERVSSIEESLNENKVDVPKLITKIIVGVVLGIPTLILGYIAFKLGIK
jgi:hypothetical protein